MEKFDPTARLEDNYYTFFDFFIKKNLSAMPDPLNKNVTYKCKSKKGQLLKLQVLKNLLGGFQIFYKTTKMTFLL
jgi:hypothetical protein